MPFKFAYLRHFNCLNVACNSDLMGMKLHTVYVPPWWADSALSEKVGKLTLFPRMQRLKSTARLAYQIKKKKLNLTVEEYAMIKSNGGSAEASEMYEESEV